MEPSIVFSGDSILVNILSTKFNDMASANKAENPSLPKVLLTKKVKDTVMEVNQYIECLLADCTPSLLQCVHLLYAAAATVADLIQQPQSGDQLSQGSWRLRLERKIQSLRRDLSRLVAGGFPPSGSPKLLYLLTGLHRKYHVSSACSFQVAIETLKQKITSYAARLRRYQQRSLRYWQNKCFQRDEKRFYSKLLDDNNTKLQPPDLGIILEINISETVSG